MIFKLLVNIKVKCKVPSWRCTEWDTKKALNARSAGESIQLSQFMYAHSFSALEAQAGFKRSIFLPATLEDSKIKAVLVYEPELIAVDGNYNKEGK